MTEKIEGALSAIASVVSGVSGIKKAQNNPDETQNEFPFSVVYGITGNLTASPIGTRKDLFNVAVEVLTRKIFLPNDIALLIPFLDTVPAALIAEVSDGGDLFSGTITTFDRVVWNFVPEYDYAGVPLIGYRFIMENVKIIV